MTTEKNRTQIRAEIGWLWQREDDNDVQTSSGAVRFNTYKTDVSDRRIEGVWEQCGVTLQENAAVDYALDYLTRPTVGGTLDIGFLDVRAVLIINHGSGTLVVSPGENCGWSKPWDNASGKNVIPPEGTLLLCSGSAPWSVTILNDALTLKATQGDCQYDIAVVGKIAEYPTSSSSSDSDSDDSAESISE